MDATVHVGLDQRAEIFVTDGTLVFLEPAAVEAISHRLVLQIAFATLIADRAIERVIDQQELHHPLLCLDRLGRVGENDHAVGCRHCARRDRLWRFLHLHETHPAISGDREPLMVAKVGNLDPRMFAGLQDRVAGRHLDVAAVDRQLRHSQAACLCCAAAWRYSAIRFSISGRKWRISP